MKTEPKIGDYVGFKKPYIGDFPIGQIIKSHYGLPGMRLPDSSKPVYEIKTPGNISFWRPASRLKKSSYKEYINRNTLKMFEL